MTSCHVRRVVWRSGVVVWVHCPVGRRNRHRHGVSLVWKATLFHPLNPPNMFDWDSDFTWDTVIDEMKYVSELLNVIYSLTCANSHFGDVDLSLPVHPWVVQLATRCRCWISITAWKHQQCFYSLKSMFALNLSKVIHSKLNLCSSFRWLDQGSSTQSSNSWHRQFLGVHRDSSTSALGDSCCGLDQFYSLSFIQPQHHVWALMRSDMWNSDL